MRRATLDKIAALEQLTADGVPVVEASERLDWSLSGIYTALTRAGKLPDVAGEARRLARAKGPRAATHGTRYAYQKGCRCDDCRDAQAAYRQLERDRTAKCGTEGGRRRHDREGTEPCQPCKDAHAAACRDRRRKAAAEMARAEITAQATADLERVIRTRIAVLAPVKSWEARARASELRALLAQIHGKERAA